MVIAKIILTVALILLFISCNENNQPANKKSITGKLQKWVQDYEKKNMQGLKSIFSKELVGSFPNSPDQKYDDVEKSYQFGNDSIKITFALQIEEVQTDQKLGFVRDRWATIKKNKLTGKIDTLYKIRSYEIWKQEDDNEWRIIRWISYVVDQ